MGKYFNVTVKPPVAVAALATGNITDAEILFDWAGFDVPKGASRLVGITALYTGKNGVYYAPTDFELFWAKGDADGTAPGTMGDDGAAVDTFGWFNNIQGKTYVDASNGLNDADLITGAVVSVQNVSGGIAAASHVDGFPNNSGLVLQNGILFPLYLSLCISYAFSSPYFSIQTSVTDFPYIGLLEPDIFSDIIFFHSSVCFPFPFLDLEILLFVSSE